MRDGALQMTYRMCAMGQVFPRWSAATQNDWYAEMQAERIESRCPAVEGRFSGRSSEVYSCLQPRIGFQDPSTAICNYPHVQLPRPSSQPIQ